MLRVGTKKRMPAMRMPRVVRNTIISVMVLLFLIIGGGVGYVYFSGEFPAEVAVESVADTAAISPVPKPSTPAVNAKVGASVQSLTTPVMPGSNASVHIRTLPEAECTIKVEYNKVAAVDSGLMPKIANEYGMVSWSWTVAKDVPVGLWPVDILCSRNDSSGAIKAKLEVKTQIE